ncbi:hypothetical protein GGER_35420 [Serratia rubidaea]
MQAEHQDIIDFLRRYPPFDALPLDALALAACSIEVSYFKAGSSILSFGQQVDAWYVIRSGAVEVYRRNGDLYNRLSAGAISASSACCAKAACVFRSPRWKTRWPG